jgi:hypothetical protein
MIATSIKMGTGQIKAIHAVLSTILPPPPGAGSDKMTTTRGVVAPGDPNILKMRTAEPGRSLMEEDGNKGQAGNITSSETSAQLRAKVDELEEQLDEMKKRVAKYERICDYGRVVGPPAMRLRRK